MISKRLFAVFIAILVSMSSISVVFAEEGDELKPDNPEYYKQKNPNEWDYAKIEFDKVPIDKYNQIDWAKVPDDKLKEIKKPEALNPDTLQKMGDKAGKLDSNVLNRALQNNHAGGEFIGAAPPSFRYGKDGDTVVLTTNNGPVKLPADINQKPASYLVEFLPNGDILVTNIGKDANPKKLSMNGNEVLIYSGGTARMGDGKLVLSEGASMPINSLAGVLGMKLEVSKGTVTVETDRNNPNEITRASGTGNYHLIQAKAETTETTIIKGDFDWRVKDNSLRLNDGASALTITERQNALPIIVMAEAEKRSSLDINFVTENVRSNPPPEKKEGMPTPSILYLNRDTGEGMLYGSGKAGFVSGLTGDVKEASDADKNKVSLYMTTIENAYGGEAYFNPNVGKGVNPVILITKTDFTKVTTDVERARFPIKHTFEIKGGNVFTSKANNGAEGGWGSFGGNWYGFIDFAKNAFKNSNFVSNERLLPVIQLVESGGIPGSGAVSDVKKYIASQSAGSLTMVPTAQGYNMILPDYKRSILTGVNNEGIDASILEKPTFGENPILKEQARLASMLGQPATPGGIEGASVQAGAAETGITDESTVTNLLKLLPNKPDSPLPGNPADWKVVDGNLVCNNDKGCLIEGGGGGIPYTKGDTINIPSKTVTSASGQQQSETLVGDMEGSPAREYGDSTKPPAAQTAIQKQGKAAAPATRQPSTSPVPISYESESLEDLRQLLDDYGAGDPVQTGSEQPKIQKEIIKKLGSEMSQIEENYFDQEALPDSANQKLNKLNSERVAISKELLFKAVEGGSVLGLNKGSSDNVKYFKTVWNDMVLQKKIEGDLLDETSPIFDAKTKKAVESLQKKLEVSAGGILGPETVKKWSASEESFRTLTQAGQGIPESKEAVSPKDKKAAILVPAEIQQSVASKTTVTVQPQESLTPILQISGVNILVDRFGTAKANINGKLVDVDINDDASGFTYYDDQGKIVSVTAPTSENLPAAQAQTVHKVVYDLGADNPIIDGKEAILVGRQGDSDVYKIGDKLFLVKDQTTNAVEVKESKLKDGNTVYYDAETLSLLEVVTPPSPQSKTHRVTQGETLAGIAQKYGKNMKDLLAANPSITDPNKIFIGQEVVIPSFSGFPQDTSNEVSTSLANTKPYSQSSILSAFKALEKAPDNSEEQKIVLKKMYDMMKANNDQRSAALVALRLAEFPEYTGFSKEARDFFVAKAENTQNMNHPESMLLAEDLNKAGEKRKAYDVLVSLVERDSNAGAYDKAAEAAQQAESISKDININYAVSPDLFIKAAKIAEDKGDLYGAKFYAEKSGNIVEVKRLESKIQNSLAEFSGKNVVSVGFSPRSTDELSREIVAAIEGFMKGQNGPLYLASEERLGIDIAQCPEVAHTSLAGVGIDLKNLMTQTYHQSADKSKWVGKPSDIYDGRNEVFFQRTLNLEQTFRELGTWTSGSSGIKPGAVAILDFYDKDRHTVVVTKVDERTGEILEGYMRDPFDRSSHAMIVDFQVWEKKAFDPSTSYTRNYKGIRGYGIVPGSVTGVNVAKR